MAEITVKDEKGILHTYIKPNDCPIPDEEWEHPLGYCWSFAEKQDSGVNIINCKCEE